SIANAPTATAPSAMAIAWRRGWRHVVGSPLSVLGEHVISRLRPRVARDPALGVVALRWRSSSGARLERVGLGVVVEHRVSPSTAVREPLAVLHHEVDVQEIARDGHFGEERVRLWLPMDLGHLGAVGYRLTVGGNAGLESLDHRGIAEGHG